MIFSPGLDGTLGDDSSGDAQRALESLDARDKQHLLVDSGFGRMRLR